MNTLVLSDSRFETLHFLQNHKISCFGGAFAESGGNNPPRVAKALQFDGSDASKRATNAVENRDSEQGKEPTALILTIGGGRQVKCTLNEQV